MERWLPVPVGPDAAGLVTRSGCRVILAVVHTLVSCQRLTDVLELLEDDPRVQVVFTVAPDAFNVGVPQYLAELGALVLPWEQARRERFDLALAASYGSVHEVHAPLVLMAHGAGHGKPVPLRRRGGPSTGARPVYGLDAQRLTRDGRVLASAMLLAHHGELAVLRSQCPPALTVASVVGDPCLDRLFASVEWRERYRAALGVGAGEQLVVLASTWGRYGLFGHVPDLLPALMAQLPAAGLRVAALIHPAVWAAHGPRQIRAWTRECRAAGLILLEPQQDWRPLVVAADCLIGDHGSVTAYGAAIGRPVLRLAPTDRALTCGGSAQRLIADRAPRLEPTRPLVHQVRAAEAMDAAAVTAALTSYPRQAGVRIGRVLYRLLGLPEPGRHRKAPPVASPRPAADPMDRQARWTNLSW